MKKFICMFLLMVIALLLLCGCGDSGNSLSHTAPDTQPDTGSTTQPDETTDNVTTEQTEVTEVPEVTEPEVPDPTEETVYDPYPTLEIVDGRITVDGSKKTYRDERITFSFPADWTGFECPHEDGTSYFFEDPTSDKSGKFSFYLTASYYIHERTTEAEYLELYSHSPELTDVKIISLTKETLSGYECTKVVASYKRDGKEYIEIDYDYVITGISRYDFTITYLVSESAACEPVLEALTDSITLATPNEMDRKVSGTVSAGGEGLNVRNGPSTTYNICGFVSDGSRVEILQRMVGDDGVLWGRTRKGWICMSYVIVDGEDPTIEKDPPSEKEPDDPYALRDIDDDRITIEGDKKTYRDAGLALSFPVVWKGLTQSGEDGSSLFFRDPEVDTEVGLSVYITLSDYARDWTEAEYLERFSYSDMNDVKIESFTKETLSGYGCTKLVVSYVYMGTEYVQTYYTHIVTGARMYEFTVTCLASEKQELEPVFASIIDSIVLSPL